MIKEDKAKKIDVSTNLQQISVLQEVLYLPAELGLLGRRERERARHAAPRAHWKRGQRVLPVVDASLQRLHT